MRDKIQELINEMIGELNDHEFDPAIIIDRDKIEQWCKVLIQIKDHDILTIKNQIITNLSMLMRGDMDGYEVKDLD